MEYTLLISICLLFTGVCAFLAPNIKPVHDCGGHHCDPHKRYCRVRTNNGINNLFDCVDEPECFKACGYPADPGGCCCSDQQCVDTFRNNQSIGVTYHGHIDTGPLRCYNCHDLRNCDNVLHHCHHADDVCMIRQTEHDGVIEAKCIKKDECNHHLRDEAMQHNRPPPTCCLDNNCTMSSLHYHTTGTHRGLHCPDCNDMLKNDCHGNRGCHHEDVCMIRHIDLRVETRCIRDKDCEHIAQEVWRDPKKLTICCHNLNCSQSAFNRIKHVNVVTSTSSTTVNTINTIPGSSSCHDDEDSSFKCADYVLNFDICNKVSGTGLALATTRCQKTCGLCHTGTNIVQTTVAPITAAHSTTTVTQSTTTTQATSTTTSSTTTSTQPTTATTVIKTTAIPTTSTQHIPTSTPSAGLTPTSSNHTCVDHDVNNGCAAYVFYFCPAQSGYAKDFAIRNCAKTCNRCDEYYALMHSQTQTSNAVPIVV